MRISMLAAVTLGLVIAAPDPAHACTCAGSHASYPRDEAVDVPTNAVLVVLLDSWDVQPTLVEEASGSELPCRTEAIAENLERALSVRPEALLAPQTRYVLSGEYPLARFTTGDGPDDWAPSATELTDLAVAVEVPSNRHGGDCLPTGDGENGQLCLDYPEPAADTAYLLLTLRSDDATPPFVAVLDTWALGGQWPRSYGASICNQGLPIIEPGAEYCVALEAVDGTGHRAGEPIERCATAASCADEWECLECRPASPEELPIDVGTSAFRAHGGGCGVAPGERGSPTWLVLSLLAGLSLFFRSVSR